MKEEHIIEIEEESKENNTNIKEKIIDNLKQNKNLVIKIIIITIILLLAIILYLYTLLQNKTEYNSSIIENAIETETTNIMETNKIEEAKIIIHITGEVKKPGVYELSEFSRISDAIEIAEAVTLDADLTNVNLAYQLSDGQKIKIPCINQENNGNYIIENSGENVIQSLESKDNKMNINTANVSELTTLPGIGESTAQKIISYREENGKFKNIEDIKNVSGIGESKYNQMKDYIKIK